MWRRREKLTKEQAKADQGEAPEPDWEFLDKPFLEGFIRGGDEKLRVCQQPEWPKWQQRAQRMAWIKSVSDFGEKPLWEITDAGRDYHRGYADKPQQYRHLDRYFLAAELTGRRYHTLGDKGKAWASDARDRNLIPSPFGYPGATGPLPPGLTTTGIERVAETTREVFALPNLTKLDRPFLATIDAPEDTNLTELNRGDLRWETWCDFAHERGLIIGRVQPPQQTSYVRFGEVTWLLTDKGREILDAGPVPTLPVGDLPDVYGYTQPPENSDAALAERLEREWGQAPMATYEFTGEPDPTEWRLPEQGVDPDPEVWRLPGREEGEAVSDGAIKAEKVWSAKENPEGEDKATEHENAKVETPENPFGDGEKPWFTETFTKAAKDAESEITMKYVGPTSDGKHVWSAMEGERVIEYVSVEDPESALRFLRAEWERADMPNEATGGGEWSDLERVAYLFYLSDPENAVRVKLREFMGEVAKTTNERVSGDVGADLGDLFEQYWGADPGGAD